jgi:hypothetical protein
MAFTKKQAKELHENIRKLVDRIKTAGDSARLRLNDIAWEDVMNSALTLDSSGAFDSAAWDALDSNEQERRADRLRQLRRSLAAAAGQDGSDNPSDIMYYDHASNRDIISMWFFIVVVNLTLLFFVIWNWNAATHTDRPLAVEDAILKLQPYEDSVTNLEKARLNLIASDNAQKQVQQQKNSEDTKAEFDKAEAKVTEARKTLAIAEISEKAAQDSLYTKAVVAIKAIRDGDVTEQTVMLMVVLLGALGGSLHMTGSFTKFIGNRQLLRSWLPYYFFMPFVGAVLASIVYMLLRVGFVSPSGASGDGSSLADLNLIGIYAFAALSGMFSKTATEKLGEVFNTIFRANGKERDPLKGSESNGPDDE